MRPRLLAVGMVMLACVGYLCLSEFYYGQTDILTILFSSIFPELPVKIVHIAFIGLAVTAGGLAPKARPEEKTREKRKPKLDVKPKGRYDVEVIIVGDGINYHEHLLTSELNSSYGHDKVDYSVDPRRLYVAKTDILKRMNDKIRGVKRRFCIVFMEGEPSALGPEQAQSETVSSGLLHVVERSTVFHRAFAELFAKQIGGKKILFILILGVVGVFVYLMWSGQIDLRRLGFF